MGRHWRVAVVLCVVSLSVLHGQSRFDGRWQGATVAGRRVALDLKEISGSRLTGTFTLDQQTAAIADGRVKDRTCSFRVAIEGRTPSVSGELLGQQLTLAVEGVPNPVLLRRVK
jgi:hypothetical protein